MTSLIWRPRWPIGAVPAYLLLRGGSDLLFTVIVTLNLVYQATVVGLSPLQLVLVGTVLEVTAFIFEIPTGVVADLVSRRLSILIGLVLVGAGFTLEGAIPQFWAVLGAQVVWGIGITFLSGATEAWITDEVGEEAVGHVFLRGTQVGLLGTMLGIPIAVALGWTSVRVPVVVGGLGMVVLAVVLALIMPERGFRRVPPGERGHMADIVNTFRDGVRLARSRPVVGRLLAVSLFVGLSSEAFDRLWTLHVLENLDRPGAFANVALWFGVISLAGTVLGLGATELARWMRPESLRSGAPVRMLVGLAAVRLMATIGFALSPATWLALPLLWTRSVAETVAGPVQAAWMNRNLESGVRATVLSFEGQLNAIGQVAGGPPLGALGSRVSVRAALVASALVFSPVMWLYAQLSDRHAGRMVTAADERAV